MSGTCSLRAMRSPQVIGYSAKIICSTRITISAWCARCSRRRRLSSSTNNSSTIATVTTPSLKVTTRAAGPMAKARAILPRMRRKVMSSQTQNFRKASNNSPALTAKDAAVVAGAIASAPMVRAQKQMRAQVAMSRAPNALSVQRSRVVSVSRVSHAHRPSRAGRRGSRTAPDPRSYVRLNN